MSDETTILRVRRGVPDREPSIEAFEVPYIPGMSILDGLIWIRAHSDPSLAFRFSCINANACKECMVQVAGKTVYACTTRLEAEGATVEPLDNKVLIRDLVTDVVPPKESLQNIVKGGR